MNIKKKIIKLYKILIYKCKRKIDLDNETLDLKSLNDLFNYFGTDKGTKVINPYYKNAEETIGHGYAKYYEEHLNTFRDKNINLLEIGTWEGGSTAAFYHYFKKAKIFCLDINFKFKFFSNRISFINCNTTLDSDIKKLEKFLTKNNSDFFDIIIDDGSHVYSEILSNFEIFFKKVKPGGLYIIEDFNAYKSYQYLNDAKKNFLDIENILECLKSKKNFNSPFFSDIFKDFCFEEISDIKINKGDTSNNGINISGISFIKKKLNKNE